jgi:hypothetical protein
MKPSELIRQRGWSIEGDSAPSEGLGIIDAVYQSDVFPELPSLSNQEWEDWMRFQNHFKQSEYGSFWNWELVANRTAEEVIAKLDEFGL